MERADFEAAITAAITEIPEHIRRKIENVAFVVEDDISTGGQRHLLGLYRGIPLNKRGGAGYSGVLPDTISIFQDAIEAQAGPDETAIRKLVREVVFHEVGHYFGFSEAKVRAWERQRRQRH